MKFKRILAALTITAVLVTVVTAATATATPSALPVTVTHTGDIQVTGTLANFLTSPQTILTTPAATYDGSPVRVTLDIEYVNEIPDPALYSNGIGFELYEDGVHLERMTIFGGHGNSAAPPVGPVYLAITLDGASGTAPAPTAGTHTFSVSVWKWNPFPADGYLRGGDNSSSPYAQPLRLSVSYFQ